MKKIIAIASTALLALAFAAPVAADTTVQGVATEKTADAWLAQVQPDAEFFAVCTYPGDKSANWLINGRGGACLDDPEGTLKVLPISALKAFIK